MTSKKRAVLGIYNSADQAEHAVDTLMSSGFSSANLSVLLPDTRSTHAADGLTGGTLGVLVGVGALAIPGLGLFIAAGPLMGGLADLGVRGAAGGLVGALIGTGVPEYEARRYERQLRKGGTLLSVHCDTSEDISLAKDQLKSAGATDIATASVASGSSSRAGTIRATRAPSLEFGDRMR